MLPTENGSISTEAEIVAYYKGVEDAVRTFAIWKHGRQFVGVMQHPLEDVLEQIKSMRFISLERGKVQRYGL